MEQLYSKVENHCHIHIMACVSSPEGASCWYVGIALLTFTEKSFTAVKVTAAVKKERERTSSGTL